MIGSDTHFWRGKRVFLTGHTGFKGSWLALWLSRLGARVTGYALEPPTSPSLFELAEVETEVASIKGDVRDGNLLLSSMRAAKPEVVLHLAAQPLVRLGYQDPVGTYSTNVMGTVQVLEAVRAIGGVRAVLNVTTDKCYENLDREQGYSETDRLGGFDPYSNSKACSELVTSCYRSAYFPPALHDQHGVMLASARAGNVIGGGDWARDRLLPDFFRSIVARQPMLVRYPHAVRPWQHVLEPLAGYLLLVRRLFEGDSATACGWNFGPQEDDAKSVHAVLDRVVQLWGGDACWQPEEGANHPHEARYLKLDCSKAIDQLGWRRRLRFDDAIDWTVAWYQGHFRGRNARSLCLDQIEHYQHLCVS